MPEQPQWSERTLDMPPQDPWADAPTAPEAYPGVHYEPPTAPDVNRQTTRFAAPHPAPPAVPPAAPEAPAADTKAPFSQGRAQVKTRPSREPYAEHEPTGTGWPAEPPAPVPAASWRWSDLRRGGEWSTAAMLFTFVCWGIWAISGGGPLTTPVIVYVVAVAVAVGVFCLARFVGHLILERQLHRVRRTARGSHVVTALYLAVVGVGFLRQTGWVLDAFSWVKGTF